MDKEEFILNESGIKEICQSWWDQGYIFEDLGYTLKNYENWGYRDNGDVIALDLGYMYPIKGNERALSCMRCSAQIRPNANFTGFICPNCKSKYNFIDIRRRMNQDLENFEDKMLIEARDCEAPDFDNLNIQ